jgi:hypothetical protein
MTRQITRHWLFVMGYLLLGVSCAQPNAPDDLTAEVSIERLRSEPYSFDFYSGIDSPERTVIRNVAEWGSAWTRIHATRSPKPPLPPIDFTTRSVILVGMGKRPTGGFGILLTGASRTSNVVTVRYETTSPGKGCGVTLAETAPIDLAIITIKSGDFVQFEETAVVKNCG